MGTGTNNEIGIRKIQNVRTGTQIGVCLRIRGSTSERHPSTHLPAVCVHDRAARRARVPRAVRHRTLSAVSLVTVGVPPPRSGRHPVSRDPCADTCVAVARRVGPCPPCRSHTTAPVRRHLRRRAAAAERPASRRPHGPGSSAAGPSRPPPARAAAGGVDRPGSGGRAVTTGGRARGAGAAVRGSAAPHRATASARRPTPLLLLSQGPGCGRGDRRCRHGTTVWRVPAAAAR